MLDCAYHWLTSTYWGGILVGSILSPIILALLCWGWRWMYRYLWPNRENWSASLLNSPIPLKGNETTSWRTQRPIRIGDDFTLDIRKQNGKGRVIDKIEFRQKGYSSAEHPKQVKITIEPGNIVYDKVILQLGHNVVLNLKEPVKAKFIAIEILEVSPNKHWAVGDILIREVRLFRKFWKVDIK